MSLPVFRRFAQANIPEAPNWIAQVFVPLNAFCEGTLSALNQNLTIGENVQGAFYTRTFTTPADYATGGFPSITFQYNGGGQPKVLLLGYLGKADGSPILTPISLNRWTISINTKPYTLTVNYIAGLAAATTYSATFVAL